MSSPVLPTRRSLDDTYDACALTDDSQTQNSSVDQQMLTQNQPHLCADSANPAGTTDVERPSLGSVTTPRTCGDDGGGQAQRIPDSVWSEFTETFRVIELAVSEGLRCSIDAPPATFQPELEMSADVAPVDRDNRQYSLQLTRRDVVARRQCEYDVTCAAVARRRDGDDVRYAVSYNRWITVARQPAAVARQPAMYEANSKQLCDMSEAVDGENDYKPKSQCLWPECRASDTTDSWIPAWPAVKQEQIEERPSCAYQFWRDDSDHSQSVSRGARFRSAIPNEFNDCRYATVSHNKVHKLLCSVFLIYYLPRGNGGYKFAVCLSVCLSFSD